MKNNRGQALIEFILVFPVFVFLIMAMFDFGNILLNKYQLENDLDYVCNLYESGKENEIISYTSPKKIQVDLQKTEHHVHVTLEKRVKLMTPGLSQVLNSPYRVSVERVLYEE